jgi:uncharacterized protein with HEPN domain
VRTDLLRVADALAAIQKIEEYAGRGRDEFETNELIQVWFLYHLAIVGEALRAMSGEFQGAHPTINWQGWTGLRNIVVHQYFRVHPTRIWDTVERDLPGLKEYLLAIPQDASDGPTA